MNGECRDRRQRKGEWDRSPRKRKNLQEEERGDGEKGNVDHEEKKFLDEKTCLIFPSSVS